MDFIAGDKMRKEGKKDQVRPSGDGEFEEKSTKNRKKYEEELKDNWMKVI